MLFLYRIFTKNELHKQQLRGEPKVYGDCIYHFKGKLSLMQCLMLHLFHMKIVLISNIFYDLSTKLKYLHSTFTMYVQSLVYKAFTLSSSSRIKILWDHMGSWYHIGFYFQF